MQSKRIPLMVYQRTERSEMMDGGYTRQCQQIISFCKSRNIHLIMDINTIKSETYIDYIHFNKSGQDVIVDLLYPGVAQFCKKSK